MESRRRRWPLPALVVCALTFGGCATTSAVYSNLERGADVSQYTRYSWGGAYPGGTGDPRLDNNEIFAERVQAAVDSQMLANGFEKTAAGSAELLVHYHASITQQIDLTDTERLEPCPDCRPFIYDAGTLVIDLVDASTNNVLWRGWAEGNVDGVVDNQQRMEARIDDDVTRIFEQFPLRRP